MAISTNDYFLKVGTPGSATTLSAPGYTVGNTTVNVGTTSGFPTDTAVIFSIDTASVSTGTQVRNPGSYCVFVGIVTSGSSIGSVSLLYGTPQNYAASALTRVYIEVSALHDNRLISGLLVQHNQDGSHGAITTTGYNQASGSFTVPSGTIAPAALTGGSSTMLSAWQTWTPTYGTGGFGTGSTVVGQYLQIGKTVICRLKATVNSTALAMGITINPPVVSSTPARDMICGNALYTIGGTFYNGTVALSSGGVLQPYIFASGTSGRADAVSNANPAAWTTGDTFRIQATYEAA